MPRDGTYEVDSSHYGSYESGGSANGQTPCIWIRHNDEYVDGRVATGVVERSQADPGQTARVRLSIAGGDRYFTTINCKPWRMVGWS
jgi:hypothetical protein